VIAPITPDDLRDSTRASGYRYVSNAQSSNGKEPLWCAKKGRFQKGTAATDWHGPCRKDPREAAQDYCDYMNGVLGTPGITTRALKSAGHQPAKRKKLSDDPEVAAALGVLRDAKGQAAGNQGYVYLIVEVQWTGAVNMLGGYGKIGYSTCPEARVRELQTGNPRKLKLVGYTKGTEEDEKRIQQEYIERNETGEWFRLTPLMYSRFDKKKGS
jgi:hypothetical protein